MSAYRPHTDPLTASATAQLSSGPHAWCGTSRDLVGYTVFPGYPPALVADKQTDPWILDATDHTAGETLPWMRAPLWPSPLSPNSRQARRMLDDTMMALSPAAVPSGSFSNEVSDDVYGASRTLADLPKQLKGKRVSTLETAPTSYHCPTSQEGVWPDSNSEYDFDSEDPDWDLGSESDESGHLGKGGDDGDSIQQGLSHVEGDTQQPPSAASSPLSDRMDIVVPSQNLTYTQKRSSKCGQKLKTLKDRGVLRTSSTVATHIPLNRLDEYLKLTRDAGSGRSPSKHAGYVIHEVPKTSPTDKRRFSFMSPAAARDSGLALKPLIVWDHTATSLSTGSLRPPRPISQRTGLPVPSQAKRHNTHLRKKVAAYFTLDARGLRCTSTAATSTGLRSLQLDWLTDLIKQTDRGVGDGTVGHRPLAGMVLHNTAAKKKPFAPTLLNWRERG